MICSVVNCFRAIPFSPQSRLEIAGFAQSTWYRFRGAHQDRVQGDWKQFSGKVKEKWGQLTDDDLAQINGNREQLEGKI